MNRCAARPERLNVTGWVRNTSDGAVKAMIQGADEAIDALIAWVRVGPPQTRVERIEISAADGQFYGFEKRA